MTLPNHDAPKPNDVDDPLRIVAGNRERLRSQHRSASRRRAEKGTSARRETSTESRHRPSHSVPEIRQLPEPETPVDSTGLELLSSKTFGQENTFVPGNNHDLHDADAAAAVSHAPIRSAGRSHASAAADGIASHAPR